MIEYSVAVNGNLIKVKASKASVAVKRALDRFKESDLECAHIKIGIGRKIDYLYRCIADVPCEGPIGSRKRDFVSGPMSEDEARKTVEVLRATRPELKLINYRRVEVANAV